MKRCGGCIHPRSDFLSAEQAAGTPYRDLIERFGLSLGTLNRHRPHIAAEVVRAIEIRKDDAAETLLQKVERIEANARRLGQKAENERDIRGALVANRAELEAARFRHEMQPAGEGGVVRVSFDFSALNPCLAPARAGAMGAEDGGVLDGLSGDDSGATGAPDEAATPFRVADE